MAPRALPVKNEPTKNPPQRGNAPVKNPPTRGVKKKEKKEKKQGGKLKVKGWLETPADWAKFNAWAKINAEPKKIPEPEPMVRASKPLRQMKKRIEILSKPVKKSDVTCRTDLGVSKKALIAKPSKRIKILAKFVVKKIDSGREFPIKISRAALRYKASKRIIEISQPHEMRLSEYCKYLADIDRDVGSRETVDRNTRLALAKKANQCPDLMTDEELDILMTSTGIYRSALDYKFTPWMEYLSLPSYRFLKDREDDDARNWKEYILEQNEIRGKKALEEKRRKEEKKIKQEEEARKLNEVQETKEENEKPKGDEETPNVEEETAEIKDDEKVTVPQEQPKEKIEEKEIADTTGDTGQKDSNEHEGSSTTVKKTKAGDTKEGDVGDEESAAARKAARNAWRFSPPPCKDDPFAIKESALKGKVSPRMAELAVPHIREDLLSKKEPFAVRQSALKGPIPEGVSRLAKPNHPRDPIERQPPREKDSFGRPIYPMPPYGRKMPPVQPYEPTPCPDKEKKDDDDDEGDEGKKKKQKKQRFIDPIVYEATIDPCIDPERSKRQIRARKAAKEEIKRRKEANEKSDEKKEEKRDEEQTEEIKDESAKTKDTVED